MVEEREMAMEANNSGAGDWGLASAAGDCDVCNAIAAAWDSIARVGATGANNTCKCPLQ